jgi:hypothetical protein
MDNFDLKKFLIENKITTNSKVLKEELYYDWSQEGPIKMNNDTKDAILDDEELQMFITPKNFTYNKNGETILRIDWMDYDQFDKLANFLGIKY